MLFIHRGNLNYEKNEFQDAATDYTEALKIEENANIFLYRAQCFCMLQSLDEATNDLLEVEQLANDASTLEKQKNLRRVVDNLTASKMNKDLLEIKKSQTVQKVSQTLALCLHEKQTIELELSKVKTILSGLKTKEAAAFKIGVFLGLLFNYILF